jgi:hypothetical protein
MEAGASIGVGTGTATVTRRATADEAGAAVGGGGGGGTPPKAKGGASVGGGGGRVACAGGAATMERGCAVNGGGSAGKTASGGKSSVGVIQLACITFFTVAGGPYGFEDTVGAAGGQWTLVGLAVVPFLWSIPLALLTAELSAMIPEAGGHIIWVDKAFGRFVSFQNGIWSFYTSALAGLGTFRFRVKTHIKK